MEISAAINPFTTSSRHEEVAFHLDPNFLREMKILREPWISEKTGKEDILAALVYYRTYSRNGDEPWHMCVKRIVEGCFRIQQRHINGLRKGWNPHKAQVTAQEMYRRIFHMKFLPPGRGLWAMGTAIVEEKGLIAALNNCCFVSTEDLDKNPTEPFTFLMDASMLGVGVGIDTKGAGKLQIFRPTGPTVTHVIDDSREGWVESVRMLITSYRESGRGVLRFDYDQIRPAGTILKTFGGISAGEKPLVNLHEQMRETLDRYIDSFLDSRGIADLCNLIGVAVVSGNIRRTAEILFGDPNDDAFINLKNYEMNPERQSYGWTSNNSIMADVGMNYNVVAEKMMSNGEPGLIWLENARKYSRMRHDEVDWKDIKVKGANPCVSADTLIMTTDGLQCAGDLIGTPFTAIIRGNAHPSGRRGFWKTGTKQLLNVKLANGMEIRVTDNHKIKIKGDIFKEAGSLEKGDLIELSCNANLDKLTYNGGRGTWEEGYIIGSLVADRTFGKTSNFIISYRLDKNANIYDHAPARLVDSYMFLRRFINNRHSRYKRPQQCYPKDLAENLKEYHISGAALTELAAEFGVVKGDKPLPVIGLSYDFSRAVVSGLFNTEGHLEFSEKKGCRSPTDVEFNGSIRLSQSNISTLKSIQIMLCNIGIVSRIYDERSEHQSLMSDGKPVYRLCIEQQSSIKRFSDIIVFRDTSKSKKLKLIVDSNKRNSNVEENFSKVSEIVMDSIEDVYDAEVSDIHLFSGSGIVVSNCVEMSLESHEMCNLVETFPNHHKTLDDYLETLRYAFLYAKTVTLHPSHWEATNEVMMRNRRIGTGISGVAQFLADHSLNEFKIWLETGYDHIQKLDKEFSDFFCIPLSIKTTTIKPSGTVSLIAGATPGMHYPIAQTYLRRVTLPKNSSFVSILKEANYPIEPLSYDENSVVVIIPMTYEKDVRVQSDVTMWEQLNLAAFLQEHWSDNQVSATITFDKAHEGPQIAQALDQYQYRLKGVSFLPSTVTSTTYAVSGKVSEATIYDDDDEHHGHIYDNAIKSIKYDQNKDTTFIVFDSKYATKDLIQEILKNLQTNVLPSYQVGMKPVPPYEHMPYEPISRAEYEERIANLKPVQWLVSPPEVTDNSALSSSPSEEASLSSNVPEGIMFCDGDSCYRV